MGERFLKQYVRDLVPYSTARDEFTGSAEIYLDANESPYPSEVNRYPDPQQRGLKAALSEMKGVAVERIFLGNGSDEAIDLLTRVVESGAGITITPPTYGMYKVAARAQGIPVLDAALTKNFLLDYSAIARASEAGSRLLFLCSPNNPVGNQLSLSEIARAFEVFEGIVVVDEAYIDFASEPSALALLGEFDRLVVLQTFSKAWGMAGVRLGAAYGDPGLIAGLSKVKLPYNVNTLTQRYVKDRLKDRAVIRRQVDEIKAERGRVAQTLRSLSKIVEVFPSEANYILFRAEDSGALFERLQARGVIIRDRSKDLNCQGCLRITIGTERENSVALGIIQSWARGE